MNILPNNYFPTLEDMGLRTPEEAKKAILTYEEQQQAGLVPNAHDLPKLEVEDVKF